ncbi:MAG: glycosyltransferase family 4 protein [Solirubrobacterales bacterium]
MERDETIADSNNSPLRVAIELTALELDRGGTARAIDQLLPLLEADPRVDIVEFRHGGSVPKSALGRLWRGLARELHFLPRELPRRVTKAGVDLLHCPSSLVPGELDIPAVITLYDVLAWDHPEWLYRANVAQIKMRMPKAIARGVHVITSSHYSKRRIIEVFDIPEDRVSVTVLGLDQRFSSEPGADDSATRSRLGIERPYLLTVGTLQPRKNVEAAIAGFELIADEHPDLDLVLVGARGWDDSALIGRIEASPVSDRVRILGRVSDDELLALYRGAECFVFPSRYEGFGFPPLEAMACGVPVVSSGATSLAEIVEGVGVVIDPEVPQEIADAVEAILGDPALRERMVSAGIEHAAQFTWARCADETIAVYEEVAGFTSRK